MQRCSRSLLLFVVLLMLGNTVFPGVTGKIEGIITDQTTGNPLPGVNVVVLNTNLGSATNQDGYYAILNVPPGVYQVRASMIGYTNVTVENVRVSIDLSTKVNYSLNVEVLAAGGSITVEANRPLLRRDEFASRHTVSEDEIAVQPIDNFEEIARNQAGVVGNHFRGGRSDEVLVLVDGVPIRDPAGTYSGDLGGFTANVPEDAIKEMEITLGGFSAEYGNVQSGVMNLAIREGGTKYHGSAKYFSTNFGNGFNNILMGERNKWFNSTYQHKKENIYKFDLRGPVPFTSLLSQDSKTVNFSFSGEVTNRPQGYFINQNYFNQSYQGKITSHVTNHMKISIGGLYSSSKWDQFYFPASKYGPGSDYQANEYYILQQAGSDTLFHYIYTPDPAKEVYKSRQGAVQDTLWVFDANRYGVSQGDTVNAIKTFYVGPMQDYLWNYAQRSNNIYLLLTHSLSSSTYYEVRLQSFFTNYHYATPDVEDRNNNGNTTEDLVWDVNQPGPHPIYRERESNYWWVRGDDPGYRDQKSWSKTLRADIVSQITDNHLAKGGIEFSVHNMNVENISWTLGVGQERKDIWKQDLVDFGAYIQDKMEFQGIIGLVGLRFDYFDPTGLSGPVYYPADYTDPVSSFNANDVAILKNPKSPNAKWQISPRIAVSHPITDRDVIRFTYGHYFQRPDGYYLYRNLSYQSLTKTGNYVGNPDLRPEKTVAYEVGVEHLFTDNIKGSINGYYKDVTDLMNNRLYVLRTLQNRETRIYFNADYGNMKGLEFILSKQMGRFWGGSINYTYSVAKGRASSSGGGFGAFESARRMSILDFDQTHTINANLTLFTPKNFLPGLNNWRINIQFDYGSGLPYSSYGSGRINDKRLPWTSTTDLRLSKQVPVSVTTVEIMLDVFNVFNRKNVEWIGNTFYYDQSEVKGDPAVVQREGPGGAYIRDPQVYSAERQFRFGIAFHF